MTDLATSVFPDVHAGRVERTRMTWPELVRKLEGIRPVKAKANCRLIKLGMFGDKRTENGSLRSDDNLLKVSGVEGDYDGEEIGVDEAVRKLERAGIRAVVYTSPSHTDEKPRWRVLAPLSKDYAPAERNRFLARLNGALGGILEPESFTLSQSYYIGPVEGRSYLVVPTFDDPTEGTCVDDLDELDALAVLPAKAPIDRVNGPGTIDAGSRNTKLTSIAGSLRRVGLSASELEATLRAVNDGRCNPPLGDDEVRTIARSIGSRNIEQTAEHAPPGGGSLLDRVAHLPSGWQLTNPPPHPFVLHPYIPRGAVSCLLGSGTSGKTLLISEWVVSIALDDEWRGHRVEAGDVLIVTYEDTLIDYHAKLYSHIQHVRPHLLPYADALAERVHFLQMQGSPARLVDGSNYGRPTVTGLAHEIVKLARGRWNIRQMFIETVSRANGADESNESLALLVSAGEIVAHELDCGVTASHHFSKAALSANNIDASAGRGGSSLPDNCRATTVLLPIEADDPQALWPVGFKRADFTDREIMLVHNPRTSYGRKAPRLHLERLYPPNGAPYLRAVAAPSAKDGPKRDEDAEKLMAWLQDESRCNRWLARTEIVTRFDEYGLSLRTAGSALSRMVEKQAIDEVKEPQYGDKGRTVTRYRPRP